MSENVFPFRRATRALPIPVGPTASSMAVPDGYIKAEYNAFLIVNPNLCWVSFKGTSMPASGVAPTSADSALADGLDWLIPPGHFSVYSTQYPIFMSAVALPMPGYPLDGLTYTPLRIYYGYGA